MINQAAVCHQSGKKEDAITLLKEAVHISHELDFLQEEAIAKKWLGKIHHLHGVLEEAINYHKEALEIYLKSGDKYQVKIQYMKIGEVLKELSDRYLLLAKEDTIKEQ